MKDSNIVATCVRCGEPIYINEIYIQQIGAETGLWHDYSYDCMKKK